MKWVQRLLLVALLCVLCVLTWPHSAPISAVRTDYQLTELEQERQHVLLRPIHSNPTHFDGGSVAQHSELFGLANSKVTFNNSELYVFELGDREGLGEFTVKVVDGCIVETERFIPDW